MASSAWRKTHGSKAKSGRKLVACEPWAQDGLSAASAPAPAARDRDEHGHFLPGNRFARMAKTRPSKAGALASLDAKAAPGLRAARKWGQRYSHHRIAEVAAAHGGQLSAGVCVLLQDAGQLRADARYLQAHAGATGQLALLSTSANLLGQARQAERDAWELAARESQLRKRTSPPAWLTAMQAEADEPDEPDAEDPEPEPGATQDNGNASPSTPEPTERQDAPQGQPSASGRTSVAALQKVTP